MITKTQKYFRRQKNKRQYNEYTETVLKQTWWLFWIIPIYSSEEIIKSSI